MVLAILDRLMHQDKEYVNPTYQILDISVDKNMLLSERGPTVTSNP